MKVDRKEAQRRADDAVAKFSFMLPDTEKVRVLVAELIAIAIEKAAEDGRQYGRMEAAAEAQASGQAIRGIL